MRPHSTNAPNCTTCGNHMQKKGASRGRIRWQCRYCRTSISIPPPLNADEFVRTMGEQGKLNRRNAIAVINQLSAIAQAQNLRLSQLIAQFERMSYEE